jgi:hypothetical protein
LPIGGARLGAAGARSRFGHQLSLFSLRSSKNGAVCRKPEQIAAAHREEQFAPGRSAPGR